MEDYVVSVHTGSIILAPLALLWGLSILASQRKEGSMIGIRHSPTVIRERLPSHFFPRVFEIAQPDFSRRDCTVDGSFSHAVQD